MPLPIALAGSVFIDGAPWVVQLGVAGTGWALVAYFVRMMFTGTLATRREVNEKDRRLQAQEETIQELRDQIGKLAGEYLPTANALMVSLHQVMDRRSDEEAP